MQTLAKELKGIAPGTFSINSKGRIEIGGCDIVELANKFGTPLFIYDEQTITDKIDAYKSAFDKTSLDYKIIYASKAFNSTAICKLINEYGLFVDVSSAGELNTALAAGLSGSKIYFHGNNKSEEELKMAIDNSIGYIVVDSFDELERVEKLAGLANRKTDILLRITPGVKAHTHKYLETGTTDCKFGFGISHGIAEKAITEALNCKNINLEGIHIHIGSQIFEIESYERALKLVLKFLSQIHKNTGWAPIEFNLGGGMGVKYTEADKPFDAAEFVSRISGTLIAECKRLILPISVLAIEPGRSLVATAGVTAYTVGTIKEIPNVRIYVSVDGGMSDNLRPALYGAKYEAIIANKANKSREHLVSIAGKHCESGDILIKEINIQKPEKGDIIAVFTTGAYGYSMANNYNKQPRPAVIMVRNGNARLIIRRETLDDLLRLDVDM